MNKLKKVGGVEDVLEFKKKEIKVTQVQDSETKKCRSMVY